MPLTTQFSIPSYLSTSVAAIMDCLLQPKPNGLGELVTVYYPPIPSAVSVPQLVPAGGKTLDLYPAGGLLPPQFGQTDPMEFGQDFVEVELTDKVMMTILWAPSQFDSKFAAGDRYADGPILTRGLVSDLQKILNCDFIEIFSEAGFAHYRFKLMGEPTIPDQLTDARYFYANWNRV